MLAAGGLVHVQLEAGLRKNWGTTQRAPSGYSSECARAWRKVRKGENSGGVESLRASWVRLAWKEG